MMDIVFIDKKSEKSEKTIIRLDAINEGLGLCTISQITDPTPRFRSLTNWNDGSVTSIGKIKEWASENSEEYDAYIFDGKEQHKLSEYCEEPSTEGDENQEGDE